MGLDPIPFLWVEKRLAFAHLHLHLRICILSEVTKSIASQELRLLFMLCGVEILNMNGRKSYQKTASTRT